MDKPTNPSEQSRGDANRRARSAARWAVALIRRHRVGAVITAALTCGVVAAPVVALAVSGPTRPAMVTTSPGPVTTTTPRQSTPTTAAPPAPSTTTAPSATTQVARAVTTPTTVRPESTTTATTALVCHDSYNPACGTFRWASPPPGAGSPTVNIQFTPSKPVAGDTVTFTVTYSDPDTSVAPCGEVHTGTPMNFGCSVDYKACPTRYGAWDPPAKQPGSNTLTYPVYYKSTGTFTFSVEYAVGTPCYDPYQSSVTGSIAVTVGPPTPSTPTTQP